MNITAFHKRFPLNSKEYKYKKPSKIRGWFVVHTSIIFSAIYFTSFLFFMRVISEKVFWKILYNYLYWFTYRFWRWGGMYYKVEGKIPEGGVIIASKHESVWDTMAPNHIIYKPCYLFKGNLLKIPVVGKMLLRMGMSYIHRQKGVSSLKRLLLFSDKRLKQGRTLIIFPEGKRAKHGQILPIKGGVYALYSQLNATIVPMALNSGKLWPKGLYPQPGIVTLKFFPSIKVGLSRKDFEEKLTEDINNLD